jgi:uncharacterized cupredoxin-like copper-binding protein
MTFARRVLIAALLIQAFGFVREILFATGLDRYVEAVTTFSDPTLVVATLVTLASLALIVPIWRGNRWAPLATVPLLVLLIISAVPVFAPMFGSPSAGNFAVWLTVTMILTSAIVAVPFAIIASLEGFGRSSSSATVERGFSATSTFLIAVGGAVLGMTTLAVAVAASPSGGDAAFDQPPDDVVTVAMRELRFEPQQLSLGGGRTTALFIVNEDGYDHSFDIDSLHVHVMVPGGQTKVVMLGPSPGETLALYCGIPGHAESGMVGQIVIE